MRDYIHVKYKLRKSHMIITKVVSHYWSITKNEQRNDRWRRICEFSK